MKRMRRALDNGLTLLVMERPHLPVVSATLLLPAGTAAEPEEKPGVGFFASQLLPLGTRRRSATTLAEDVDGLGAALSTSCDFDFATVEISGLAADARVLLDILGEVALEPAFLPEEVERKRSQILGMLERRKDDYVDVVRNRFIRMIYGRHPYGRVKEGTSESVAAIAGDDIVRFYENAYGPAGSILAIVGDIREDDAARWVDERFGGWTRPGADPPLPVTIPPPAAGVTTVQQEVTQAYIRMGNIGITRDDPDHDAIVLTNYILGGSGFGSRLMKNLREERGLTYGVYSSFLPRKEPGYFFASTQTGIDTMNEAITEMLAEIRRFVDGGVTDDELSWAKKYFTGSMPLTLETNDQLAQKLLEQEFYGLPDEFWLRELERMQQVTREEVLAAARRKIHPEQFAIVILGDFREHRLDVPGIGTGDVIR